MERHTATERVTDDDGPPDAELVRHMRDLIGELREARVGGQQRRRKRHAREIDDVHRRDLAPEHADLGRQCARVRREAREHDRVWPYAATPGGHAEPVTIAPHDADFHDRTNAHAVPNA